MAARQPACVVDVADAAVVCGQDDAHPVVVRRAGREMQSGVDLREHLCRQPDVGLRIEEPVARHVELARHGGHDLHQSGGAPFRNDVGRETRFVVGDGAHQTPVVTLLFADRTDQFVVNRDGVGDLRPFGTADEAACRAVAVGAEIGVQTVEGSQQC